jgi:hypothetical protein
MNRKEFEQILDRCIGRLEEGASLGEILQDYPEQAARLESLLKAAYLARSLPNEEGNKSQRENRNRLLAEADRLATEGIFMKNGTKMKKRRYSGQWFKNFSNLLVGKENAEMKLIPRLALYGLMTVLIAGFFSVNASASSLPGDSLYRLKLGWEQAQLALTFDEDSRHELELEFEHERLDEVESLLGEGRQEDVEFHGLIESKADGSWVISGISVVVDARTELKGSLEVGDLVKVEALTQADSSLLALEIYADGADMDEDLNDDSDDDMYDDSDDDKDDDSDDDMDDDSDDDMDDDSYDDMDDDSADDMNDDYDDDMDDDSDDDMSDDYDDDDSDDDMDDDSDDDMDEKDEEDESDD